MPAVRPCAAFEPISPDLDLNGLVESTPNFQYVVRIHCDMIDDRGMEDFEKLVVLHVILGGKPLVVEGYQERLERWTFALQWLKDNFSTKVESARDLTKKSQLPLSVGHYLNNMALLTNQWTPRNYKDPERQRIYLKDIDCPPLWHEKVKEIMPLGLFYLNDTTGNFNGLGAMDEPDPRGGARKGRGIAKAGDLMSSLPPEMRAENLMCYIGHEGTYTPAHREMCASLGQNVMVETSTGTAEEGKPSKPGSSIWFMTESKDRHLVSEYWLNTLGHDIEIEDHFAQINAWRAAPFSTYIVEQRVGDLILIPPLAPHQVWNRGTRTMKVAWNRTTVETLEMALNEALPRARMVCRDEQYKNKAIIYFTCNKYSRLLKVAERERQKRSKRSDPSSDAKIRQLQKDFRRLHNLYTRILISESFLPANEEKGVEYLEFDSFITCSYCRCNIFNRFLTCPTCIAEGPDGSEDTYDICMECYAMGRSCACISKLRWVEQFKWIDLVQKHEAWRLQIIQHEGTVTEKSPLRLKTEIQRFGKRTLAQICQSELKRRPWNDITKPMPVETKQSMKGHETVVDENGNVSRKKIRRTEKWEREHKNCHICKWKEPTWKQAECYGCGTSFCYGSLFRGFEIMPQTVLENERWMCPKCMKICPCRDCSKRPGSQPYQPSSTIPGWDTKKIADPRSVQSLVDFGQSNMNWLKKAGDDHPRETRRLERRAKAAEAAKAKDAREDMIPEHYDSVEQNVLRLADHEGLHTNGNGSSMPLDPQLANDGSPSPESDDSLSVNEDPEFPSSREYRNRGSPPKFGVPPNGIVRDIDHAYEQLDAITYDYPDPESAIPIAPVEQPESAPEFVPGYEAAYTEIDEQANNRSPTGHIEMVNKKRKRSNGAGTAENRKKAKGDRLEAADPSPQPLKPSRSLKGIKKIRSRTDTRTIDGQPTLLLKLPMEKQRLEDLNRRISERGPLNGTGAEAPKIASDLRALNVTGAGPWATEEANAAGSARKARVERDEEDENYAPSRRRDRRKDRTVPLEEPTLVAPTRRPRKNRIEYGDMSDLDDFEEDFGQRASIRPSTSSASHADRGQYITSNSPIVIDGDGDADGDDDDDDDDDNIEDIASAALASAARANQTQSHQKALNGASSSSSFPPTYASTSNTTSTTNRNGTSPKTINPAKIMNNQPPPSRPRPSSSTLTQPRAAPAPASASTAATAANLNRRAKLAAAQWAEGNYDNDSLEEYSASEDGDDSDRSDDEEDGDDGDGEEEYGRAHGRGTHAAKSSLRPKGMGMGMGMGMGGSGGRGRPAKEVQRLGLGVGGGRERRVFVD